MANDQAMAQPAPEGPNPNGKGKKAVQAMALARVDSVRMEENGMLMMINHDKNGRSYDVMETDAKTWEDLLKRHALIDDSLKFPAISKNNPNEVYLKDGNLGRHSTLSGMEFGVAYGSDGSMNIVDDDHFLYVNKDGSTQENRPEFKEPTHKTEASDTKEQWVYFDGVQRDGDQTYLLSNGAQIPISKDELRDFERDSGVGKNSLYDNNLLSDFEKHPESKAPFFFKDSQVGLATGLTAIAIKAPVDTVNQRVNFSMRSLDDSQVIDYQLDNDGKTEYMKHEIGQPTHLFDKYKNPEQPWVNLHITGDNPKTKFVQPIPIDNTHQVIRDGLAMDKQLSDRPGSNMLLPAQGADEAIFRDINYDSTQRPLRDNLIITGLQVGQNDKLYALTADDAGPEENSSFEISKHDWNRIARTTQLDNVGLDADSIIEHSHQQPANKTRIDFADLKVAQANVLDFNAINVQSNFKTQDDGQVLFDFDHMDHDRAVPVVTLDKVSSDGYNLSDKISKEMDRIKIDSQQAYDYPFSSNLNERDMVLDSRVAFNSGNAQKFVYRVPKDNPFSVSNAYDDVVNGYKFNLKEAFNPQLQLNLDAEPIPVVEPNQEKRDQLLNEIKQTTGNLPNQHNSYSGEMSIAGLQMDDNRNLYALTEEQYKYGHGSDAKTYRGTFEISYEDWDRIAKTTHLDERGLSSKDLLENFTNSDMSRVEFSSMGQEAIKSVRIQAAHSINLDGQVKFDFDNVKTADGVPNIYLKSAIDYSGDPRVDVNDFHLSNSLDGEREIDKNTYVPRMQRLYPDDLMLVDINPVNDVINDDFISHLKESMQPNDTVQERMNLTSHDKVDSGVANVRLESLTPIAGVGYVGTFKPTSAEEKAPQGQTKPVDSTILDYDDVHKILKLNGYSNNDATAILDTIDDANETFAQDPLSDDVSHLKDVVDKPLYVKMDYKDDKLKPDTIRDVLAPDTTMEKGAYQQGDYTNLDTISNNVDKEVDKPLYNRVQGLLAQRRVLRMQTLEGLDNKPNDRPNRLPDETLKQMATSQAAKKDSKPAAKHDDGPDL